MTQNYEIVKISPYAGNRLWAWIDIRIGDYGVVKGFLVKHNDHQGYFTVHLPMRMTSGGKPYTLFCPTDKRAFENEIREKIKSEGWWAKRGEYAPRVKEPKSGHEAECPKFEQNGRDFPLKTKSNTNVATPSRDLPKSASKSVLGEVGHFPPEVLAFLEDTMLERRESLAPIPVTEASPQELKDRLEKQNSPQSLRPPFRVRFDKTKEEQAPPPKDQTYSLRGMEDFEAFKRRRAEARLRESAEKMGNTE